MFQFTQSIQKILALFITISVFVACQHGGLTEPIDEPMTSNEGVMVGSSNSETWSLSTFIKVPEQVDSAQIVTRRNGGIVVKHIDKSSPLLHSRHIEYNDTGIVPQDTIVYEVTFFLNEEIFSIAKDTVVVEENNQIVVIKTDQRPSFKVLQDSISVNQEVRITEILLVDDDDPFTVDVEWKLVDEKEWLNKKDVMSLPKGLYKFLVRLTDAYGQVVEQSFFLEIIALPISSSVEQSSSSEIIVVSSSEILASSSSEVVVVSSSEDAESSSSELVVLSSLADIVSSSSEMVVVSSSEDIVSSSSEIVVSSSSDDAVSSSSEVVVLSSSHDVVISSSSLDIVSSSSDVVVSSSSNDVVSSSSEEPIAVSFDIVCNPSCNGDDAFGSVFYPEAMVYVGDTLSFTAELLYDWSEVEGWSITGGDAEIIEDPEDATQIDVVFNSSDVEITIDFTTKPYMFGLSATESEHGSITLGQTMNVPIDTEIEITATPNDGYEFVGWSATMIRSEAGDKAPVFGDVNSASTTIKLYTGVEVSAEFAPIALKVKPVILDPIK